MIRKTNIVFLILWMSLFLSCQQLNEVKTLTFAHNMPTTHPVHQGIVALQEKVAEQSGGKLLVKIYPDGQLGSEREVLELLQIGSIAMTKVSAAAMANFVPEYKVLGVPYIFRDKDHLFKTLNGELGESLLAKGSNYWLRGLCFYDAGSRSFYTKEKLVRTPEDLKDLKIRVMNDQMSVDMVNALGASATPMSFGELYTALQQGVVDGAENNPPSLVSSNHYEVCKYYSLDEHSFVPDVVLIGTKFWGKLSIEEQSWLKNAAKESVQDQKKYWAASVAKCMETLETAGVTIYRPDQSLFAKEASTVLEAFSKDPEMKKLVNQIKAIN